MRVLAISRECSAIPKGGSQMDFYDLYGLVLNNAETFLRFRAAGFHYIINPDTHELHAVQDGSFFGAHNLTIADLGSFIGVLKSGPLPIHLYRDGSPIKLTNLVTGEAVIYTLNKCRFCYPD
jgi:hypothetical protein